MPGEWRLAGHGDVYALTSADGPLATVKTRDDWIARVDLASGSSWTFAEIDAGYRFAALGPDGAEVLRYLARKVASGGRLVLAPDHEYAVRSKLLKLLDWQIYDGNGTMLIDADGSVDRERGYALIARHRAPCTIADHEPILVTFVATLGLMAHLAGIRDGRAGADWPDVILP